MARDETQAPSRLSKRTLALLDEASGKGGHRALLPAANKLGVSVADWAMAPREAAVGAGTRLAPVSSPRQAPHPGPPLTQDEHIAADLRIPAAMEQCASDALSILSRTDDHPSDGPAMTRRSTMQSDSTSSPQESAEARAKLRGRFDVEAHAQLRDQFAMAAVAGCATGPTLKNGVGTWGEDVADMAYAVADAMLARSIAWRQSQRATPTATD